VRRRLGYSKNHNFGPRPLELEKTWVNDPDNTDRDGTQSTLQTEGSRTLGMEGSRYTLQREGSHTGRQLERHDTLTD
jgi:hypothetical protein